MLNQKATLVETAKRDALYSYERESIRSPTASRTRKAYFIREIDEFPKK